ncbi:galactokinase family protein [Fontivita pretiosa]|uniref:galactokinase family protein n=1 Tax=Fontivita pretiosa TaxID=2989684 RepID=UPI003D17468A
MSAVEAAKKEQLLARCARCLGAEPQHWMFVPGRIEFMGKHTDYAGGRSLVCAVERGFCLAAVGRDDSNVCITDAAGDQRVVFTLSPELVPMSGHWSNYPMTVARRLARNFPGPLRGADVAFVSDLPPAAGLSSSSSLVTAIFLALHAVNHLQDRSEYQANIHTLEDLAGYLGTVENGQTFGWLIGDRGVGTFGGSQDHTAILCSRPGMLRQYAFRPVRHEQDVPLPRDCIFAIGVSGVVAEKTGSALGRYNRASTLATQVLQVWNSTTGRNDPTLAAAVRSSPDAPQRMRLALRQLADHQPLLDRFEQFFEESEQLIPAAAAALLRGDLQTLGQIVARSQQLAEIKLGNQVPQTIDLCRMARDCGAIAASAFGAGFGGSVWAMIRRQQVDQFLKSWRQAYLAGYPQHTDNATFFLTRAGPAVVLISSEAGESWVKRIAGAPFLA